MRKVFTKENTTGILISVIASIIFVRLVDPLMDLLGMIGIRVIEAFVNKYYAVCANATDYQFIRFVAYIVFIIGITGIWDVFKYFAFPPKRTSIEEKSELMYKEKIEESDLSNIENEVTKLSMRMQKLKASKEKQQKQRVIISRIMLVATSLCFIWVILFVFAPTLVKGEFDRKIIQITPYVTEERINLLKSDWVSMESKADYKEISEYIDSVLVENGLK